MPHRTSSLINAAAAPAYLARGCVNVIEFEGLREQAGPRWSRIREGVYARLETLLRAKLGPNDIFLRLGEVTYLVTMPTTEPDGVNAVCTRIAFDLHTSFLGQCDLTQIMVSVVSSDDADTLALKRLPPDQIAIIAGKLGILDMLGIRLATGDPGDAADTSISARPTELAAKPINTPRPLLSDAAPSLAIEYHYIPIWSVPNMAITTYACEPKTILSLPQPQPLLMCHLPTKERLQAELSALQVGIKQLSKSLAAGNRFLLAAPISFEVFGMPAGRAAILAACKELSGGYQQYLAFIIYDVPPGVAHTRLANMVNAMRTISRSVSATIAPTSRAYTSYQGIGLKAIGFDLREFAGQAQFGQHDAEQLSQFARRSNLGTFFAGVQDKTALKYAQDAHIQLLSGAAIAPPCPEPQGMRRLTWTETLSTPNTELWV